MRQVFYRTTIEVVSLVADSYQEACEFLKQDKLAIDTERCVSIQNVYTGPMDEALGSYLCEYPEVPARIDIVG